MSRPTFPDVQLYDWPTNFVCDDIQDYLIANGILNVGDSQCFEWQSGKDKQILIRDSGGFASAVPESSRNNTFQVLLRGAKDEGHKDLAEQAYAICKFLVNSDSFTVNNNRYSQVFMVSDPSIIGRDEENRALVSINFSAAR